jgi:Family of unknown function (DUF5681)
MENDNREGGYEIGYRKPPRNTRFEKGRSGNSRGRPRGAKNFTTIVGEALREPVVINENGQRKRTTKMDVIFRQLANKAAKGDHRSIQAVISFLEKHPIVNIESTAVTAAELDGKVNLLRDAVEELRKLGVPGVTEGVDAPMLGTKVSDGPVSD